jgi:peptidoglycan hydrolase-like protein with peptidoglycan-binding domain
MAMYLRVGSVGPNVFHLQQMLNYLSDPWHQLAVDGIFGPLTRARVVEYQKMSSLRPDGVVGPLTGNALFGSVLSALCSPVSRAVFRSRLLQTPTRR